MEAPLSRQVGHQYRVEPEEDARSEGTLDSQEAARGRLAALDIDLENKTKMHVAYHTEPPKWHRAYWVANPVAASRFDFGGQENYAFSLHPHPHL